MKNTLIALPIAAAVPIASPALADSMPSQDADICDYAAMLCRAETAIETFRTRVIRDDFTLDNEAAERVLRYFKSAAEGRPDDEDEWSAVIDFFGHHGIQVLGWILHGGVEGMICTTAALAVLERSHSKDADHVSQDPIFAAIETHKAAKATWVKCVHDHGDLEEELPRERRRSTADAWEVKIIETDDPRWIESERAMIRTSDAETDAAVTLVSIRPTTLGGVLGLLKYATEADTDGEGWPCDLVSDDGEMSRSWHYFMTESVAEAMAGMVLA
jgi:hypothetical protein